MFDSHLRRWNLTPDGEPIVTHSSRLLPVRCTGAPAMLKIPMEAEERRGGLLMCWWDGDGAARVLAHDADALLLERATGTRSLIDIVHGGADDDASRVICNVAARLHAPRGCPPPELLPLTQWFEELWPAAARHGGVLGEAAAVARALLGNPQGIVALHGDLHHGNVLDFGERGWLAIDPKRLIGERGFDFANIFCNPDLQIATARGRLTRQASVIAQAAGLERKRLLQWVLAYSGLSAAWILGDGEQPELDRAVAEMAACELASL